MYGNDNKNLLDDAHQALFLVSILAVISFVPAAFNLFCISWADELIYKEESKPIKEKNRGYLNSLKFGKHGLYALHYIYRIP